jgi:ADP-ribose pyrophosphatase YjhB (NUDIX family)
VSLPPFLREIREKVGNRLLVLPSASGVVLDEAGRMLLIRHAVDGKWVVPGGVVEPDEHPAARVVEEVREETGLDVEVVRLVGVCGGPQCRVVYGNGDEVSYVAIVYECAVVGGSLEPDGVEAVEAAFFARDEICRLELSSIGREILAAALAG